MSRNNNHLDQMADGMQENQSAGIQKPAPANSPLQQRLDERLRELQARSGRLSNAMRNAAPTPTEPVMPEPGQPAEIQPPTHEQADHAENIPTHETVAPANVPSPELSRIRERLDTLAQKLQSATDQVTSPIARESIAQEPIAQEPIVQEPMTHEPVMQEPADHGIQAQAPVHEPATAHVEEDYDAENFQKLSAELHAMREAMEHISRNNTAPVDIESVSQSIQSGYSQIASMLDSHFERISPGADWNSEHAGQLSALDEHVSGLREAVDAMQTRLPTQGLSERIEEIGNAITHLTGNAAEATPQQFEVIESRLDELTRAIVAVSANPADNEDSIHRLEARLTAITKSVDEIAESSRQLAVEQAIPREIEELAGLPEAMRNTMEKVEARLSSMESAGEGDDHTAAQLAAQISELSLKIDQVVESGNVDHRDEAAIIARFDAIDARLEQLAEQVLSNNSKQGAESLSLIESQLVALNDRLEHIPLERQDDTVSEREAEVLSILEALSAKVEQIDAGSNARAAEALHVPVLEEQLSAIASSLETITSNGADFSPVEKRLESIEQQIALSRDLAIDVASKAAEQAVMSSGGNSGGEAIQLDPLIQELRNLEQQSQEMDRRNYDGFTALHEIMDRISSRLDMIENGIPVNADPVAPESYEPDPHEVPSEEYVQEAYAEVDDSQSHAEYSEIEEPQADEAPVAVSSRLSSLEGAHEEENSSEFEEFDQPEERPAPDNEELMEALAEMPAPETVSIHPDPTEEPPADGNGEIEDVPLEPGSGVPDLAALVRHASEKRKSGQSDPDKGNIADILNDARNAAKAAASDAAIAAMLEEEAKERERKKFKGGFVGVLKKRRKALMVATAVIVVVAISIPIATRFLGNETLFSKSNAPAVQITDPISDEGADQTGNGQLASAEDDQTDNLEADAMIAEKDDPEASVMVSAVDNDGAIEAPMIMENADNSATNPDTDSAAMISKTASDDNVQTTSQSPTVPMESAKVSTEMAGSGQPEQMVSVKEIEKETTTSAISSSMDEPVAVGRAITVAPMPPAETGNIVLRQAAAKGDGRALFEIGRRYTEGEQVDRDLAEASKWYELSADANYAPGQYRYANFLEKGHGGKTDLAGAAKWYEKAAENGNALAMHNLAVLYTSGLVDGKPNMKSAIDWFEKAAALGVKDSQVNLGIINAQGLGLTADLTEAYKWFAIAAKGGDSDAAGKRDSIANAMLPERLAEARGAAEIWKPVALDPEANVPSVSPGWKNVSGKQASLTEREMIKKAQELLTRKGFDPGPADGLMGDRTRQAISSFKKQVGMPDDSSVSTELLKALSDGSA